MIALKEKATIDSANQMKGHMIGQNGEHAQRPVTEEHNPEHEHVRVVQHVVLKQMNETVL